VVVNERERECAMSELIQAVVTIKDPFTLFAFLAVILLIAFRTKTVPESMFKLVSAKITRDRFYALLNRAMLSAAGYSWCCAGSPPSARCSITTARCGLHPSKT
jgi:hypothetical protein